MNPLHRAVLEEMEVRLSTKTLRITAIASVLLSLGTGWIYAQQAGAPQLLFSMTMQNETRLPLTQNSITTPNVDLQLYGDGKNIVVAVGSGANLPRAFFGLCEKP